MHDRKTSRREFLETVGTASALIGSGAALGNVLAENPERLAVDGGTPVRASGLGSAPYGPLFYDEAEQQELLDVLKSRSPFRREGGKVAQFEKAYAAHIGAKFAIGVTSGTTALYAAMAALEIGPGDEVILPAWNWYADYDAIVLSGALPVFAEIDDSFGIDPGDIERLITPRTKAIIAAHLEGCPCDMDAILAIARKHKLRVLEDCAQCAGGKYKGKYVGTIGDIGINSFQLSKTITSGEGGAVVTNDPVLYERAFRFHDVGTIDRSFNESIGHGILAAFASCNFRMNEFTAAVLCGQLKKLETICGALRTSAKKVRAGIADLPGLKLRKSGDIEGDLGMRIFLDMGNRQRRDRFLRAIRAEGISAAGPGGSVILPIDQRVEKKVTLHPEWPSFQSPQGKAIRYGAACCPRTIDILGRHGGVTIGPKYNDQDVADVIKAIRKVYRAMPPA
ncbi:MAG: DegT/DnrJ/EryC1/StrS family aminotransferase [Pirellulales bacterium]